jgi:hypothetical protein
LYSQWRKRGNLTETKHPAFCRSRVFHKLESASRHGVPLSSSIGTSPPIFIAFFLQYYFASRASDDRAEKDILLDNARDVFGMLRSCRDEVMSCHGIAKVSKASQQKIIRLYRTLSNGLVNLQNAIEMSGCTKLTEDCDAVLKRFVDYKVAATGKFPYDPSDIGYQEQTYRNLMRELHSLAFKINKHR